LLTEGLKYEEKFIVTLFSVFISTISADDLADILQDLAVQTACLGMYSIAQTGVYVTSRYDDPPDYYNPPMMANRFASMSGNMTRVNTFYGVCFDYAQFAWDDIKKYQKKYNDAGMKSQQWYIAIANVGDPYTIILYDPVSKEKATIISNGVYLKENSRRKIYAHDGATGHAWLWVQHKNGTWYWIDPTWTDNTGYVWWGIVENGREVQYYPDPEYCVASNYPRQSTTNTGTRGSSTTSTENTKSSSERTQPRTTSYRPEKYRYISLGYSYSKSLPIGITYADSMDSGRSQVYISTNCNLEFSQFEWILGIAISATNWLRIPVGIGVNHTSKEVKIPSGRSWTNGVLVEETYYDSTEWENKFVMEVGLQPVIFDTIYFSINYRLTGFSSLTNFSKDSFVIGAGFIF
jgi:hypothetical protein